MANVVKLTEQRNITNSKINEIIEITIIEELTKIGLKYKSSMYDIKNSRDNAIPIKEVRARLREMIENDTFNSDLDTKLTVEHHTTSSTINFYAEQHPDIYRVYEGEQSEQKAIEIKNHLRQTFVEINS